MLTRPASTVSCSLASTHVLTVKVIATRDGCRLSRTESPVFQGVLAYAPQVSAFLSLDQVLSVQLFTVLMQAIDSGQVPI